MCAVLSGERSIFMEMSSLPSLFILLGFLGVAFCVSLLVYIIKDHNAKHDIAFISTIISLCYYPPVCRPHLPPCHPYSKFDLSMGNL